MNLKCLACIEGPNLIIRLIRPDDAEYLYSLRTDPAYNSHLSPITGTANDQRRWIEDYKQRETERREFYYVIERRDGLRCGVVRLYNVGSESFTWGSWILDANKPRKAALESAVLSFGVGFDLLDLPTAFVDVRVANDRARAFYTRLRMTELSRDQCHISFVYSRERFRADRASYEGILNDKEAL
jgi:RimJ/RimL family protein N-acetyltransferase